MSQKDIYLLSNTKQENINNLPIIEIKYLDFNIDLSSYDILLFTSKNSVTAIDKQHQKWKEIPSFAISAPTAKKIKELNGKLVYTGEAKSGDSFAYEIAEQLKGKKVLYIRAKKVVSKLRDILKNSGVELDEIIAYETVCKEYKEKTFKNNSIFIFTSPSTIDCFFKSFKWDSSFKAVAIGETTADALPKDIEFYIAKDTSIQSCIDTANSL